MRAILLIDPRGVPVQQWCDMMALELDRFGTIPILGFETDWKTWAREVIQLSEISRSNPPNPDQYDDDDFEEWAIDFNDSISEEL